jgi:hypothetical protein
MTRPRTSGKAANGAAATATAAWSRPPRDAARKAAAARAAGRGRAKLAARQGREAWWAAKFIEAPPSAKARGLEAGHGRVEARGGDAVEARCRFYSRSLAAVLTKPTAATPSKPMSSLAAKSDLRHRQRGRCDREAGRGADCTAVTAETVGGSDLFAAALQLSPCVRGLGEVARAAASY